MINEDIRHIIEAELRPDESLIWADSPASFPINFMGIYVLLFSIVWCSIVFGAIGVGAFGGFEGTSELPDSADEELTESDISAGGLIIGSLFGLAFVSIFVGAGLLNLLMGLKMTIGPAKQLYAITSERIIILDKFFSSRVASFRPDQLAQIERNGNDSIGSLTFGSAQSNFFSRNMYWKTPLNKFHKIQHPRDVENLIHQTFTDKGTPS